MRTRDYRRITLAEAQTVKAHDSAGISYTYPSKTLREQIEWAEIANRDQHNPSDSIYIETSTRGAIQIQAILEAK